MCGINRFFFMVFFGVLAHQGFSQGVPKGINYQACARNYNGDELTLTTIGVRISIYAGTPAATDAEWIENHSVVTNTYGIFSLIIGQGSRENASIKDDFEDIEWGSAPHYMKVEIDFGSGYRNMGVSQFVSVPYAMYAERAGQVGDTLEANTFLSLEGNNLSIKGGNTVTLNPDDEDASILNEIQDLRWSGDSIYINKNLEATKIDLSRYRDNTDNQTLGFSNGELSISGGNAVDISQTLSYSNGLLSISDGNSVDIRTQLIGFSSYRDDGGIMFTDSDTVLVFTETEETGGDNYIESTGIFTVPANGAGLYMFTVTYDFDANQRLDLKVTKGGNVTTMPLGGEGSEGDIQGFHTLPALLLLNDGDKVGIKRKATAGDNDGSGRFSGYKIR